MANAPSPRKHSNLYYILEADQQKHRLPPERAEMLRQKIFKNFQKT